MTATMTAADPLAVTWEAARERVEARRNRWRSYTEAERRQAWVENRELPRQSSSDPAFRAPETLGEWLDDRITERHRQFWSYPETRVLIAIADAARGGAEAAVKAATPARSLDRRAQWGAYSNLLEWKREHEAAKLGADRIINAVLRAWEKSGLAAEDPDEDSGR